MQNNNFEKSFKMHFLTLGMSFPNEIIKVFFQNISFRNFNFGTHSTPFKWFSGFWNSISGSQPAARKKKEFRTYLHHLVLFLK